MGAGKKKKLAKLRNELEKSQKQAGLGAGGITIAQALAAETDRGCALVAGEFLSDALGVLIVAKFDREDTPDKIKESLIGGFEAPLGTFAMRARACRAFGLINHETYQAIDRIREIRNPCAHRSGPIYFTDPELTENVRWLTEYIRRHPTEYPDGRLEYGWPWWDEMMAGTITDQRRTFMDAATTAWSHVFAYGFYFRQWRDFQPRSRIANPTAQSEPPPPQE